MGRTGATGRRTRGGSKSCRFDIRIPGGASYSDQARKVECIGGFYGWSSTTAFEGFKDGRYLGTYSEAGNQSERTVVGSSDREQAM